MADDKVPEGSDEDRLALPSLSLGFRRRRKRRGVAAEEVVPDPVVPDPVMAEAPVEDRAGEDPATGDPAAEDDPLAEEPAAQDDPLAEEVELGSEADEPDLPEPDATETRPIEPIAVVEPAGAVAAGTEPVVDERGQTGPVQPVVAIDAPVSLAEQAAEAGVDPEAAAGHAETLVVPAEPEPVAEPTAVAEPETEPVAASAAERGSELADTEVGTMYPHAGDTHTGDARDTGDTEVLQVARDGEDEDEDASTGIDWGDESTTTPAEGPRVAETKPPKPRRSLSLPGVDGRVAAVATGLVVGLSGVAFTYLFQRGCEAVKGTGSCGTIGLLLLVVVLVAMILEGGALLRVFKQSDSLSTSFLAVGLVAVIAMLFLLPVIDRWYMVVVIPLVAAGTYLLSWWVTNSFGDSTPAEQEVEAPAERESAERS